MFFYHKKLFSLCVWHIQQILVYKCWTRYKDINSNNLMAALQNLLKQNLSNFKFGIFSLPWKYVAKQQLFKKLFDINSANNLFSCVLSGDCTDRKKYYLIQQILILSKIISPTQGLNINNFVVDYETRNWSIIKCIKYKVKLT